MTAGTVARPHLLLFEPDGRGHAQEWIEHLLDWLARSPRDADLSILTDQGLYSELSNRAGWHGRSRIRIRALTARETAFCNSRRLSVSGMARWWVMRRHLRLTGASHGIFLGIDHLSLALGLGLGTGSVPLSGILFRPTVHYDPPSSQTWKERIREIRKNVLYQGMLSNPSVSTIWSLDPDFPSYAVTKYRMGEKVRAIPDPIGDMPASPLGTPVSSLAASGGGRTRFLLFGVLAERKGVLTLLDALQRIEPHWAAAMHVTIAGTVDPSIADRFRRAVNTVREIRPELWLDIDERRLPKSDLANHVADTDVILVPYQRFAGSSGVLLWAASAGKPVITQSYGLVGRLVDEYRLGRAVDTTDPSDLAAALVAAVRDGYRELGDSEGMARFADCHSPEVFASRIMETILGFSFDANAESPAVSRASASTD
ncbi:MAG: glycosyltransferase [Rhodospirillaceae bacterium]